MVLDSVPDSSIVRKISLIFGARQTVMGIIAGSFNNLGILGKFTTVKWVCSTYLPEL